MGRDIEDIRAFFEPRNVAIVGVSRTPEKFGNTILRNLLALGYEGGIYPVNPRMEEIEGVRCYPSLLDIPEAVEVATLAVPASAVAEVMRDCALKGVRGVVIIASGFNEAGEDGMERQREMLRIAGEAGIRVVGPNTTGILNPYRNFTTSFAPITEVRAGNVAFVAQTGMFVSEMLSWIVTSQRFGISKVAGLGNKSDVADDEVLEYLGQDPTTTVIMIYMEGPKNPRRFLEVAQRVSREKPIIVLKGGRTEAGAQAARSHTGSLAGSAEVFDALLRQAGALPAEDLEDMVDLAKAFSFQPLPRGNRVGIVSISGGRAVMSADACVQGGLKLAQLGPDTLQGIQEKLPSWARAGHPIDYEPLFESVGPDAWEIAIEAALADENVDLCLLSPRIAPEPDIQPQALLELLERHPGKPITVGVLASKEECDLLIGSLEEVGIPAYVGVRRAARSLAALYRYRAARDSLIAGGALVSAGLR